MTQAEISDNDEKEFPRYSTNTIKIIIAGSILIALIASINGMNAEWARAISTSLLTVNGLVFGFVILGVTNLSNKDFVKAIHISLIRKHMNELFKRVNSLPRKLDEEEIKQLLNNEFNQVIEKTYYTHGYLEGSFLQPVYFLFISIGLSFCLYGINRNYDVLSIPWTGFLVILYLALVLLIIAAYNLIQSFFEANRKITLGYSHLDKKLIESIIDERIAEEERRKNTASQ